MIGRGTRSHAACHFPERLPNGRKSEFLILDFWDNDFDKSASEELAQSLPVLVSLFNNRLKLLDLRDQFGDDGARVIADLRALIAQIPLDSFLVKRVLPELREAWEDRFWQYLSADRLDFLRLKVAPLLRYAPGVDVAGTTFTNKLERLKFQVLSGTPSEETVASIREDVSRLPSFVADAPAVHTAVALCLSPQLPTASVAQLDAVIDALAPQMRHRRNKENSFLTLDLPDFVEMRGFILLKGGSAESMPNISKEKLFEVRLPIPPENLQQEFAQVVQSYNRLRAQQREALRQAEHLFDALLHRAFRGELGAGDVGAVEALASGKEVGVSDLQQMGMGLE